MDKEYEQQYDFFHGLSLKLPLPTAKNSAQTKGAESLK